LVLNHDTSVQQADSHRLHRTSTKSLLLQVVFVIFPQKTAEMKRFMSITGLLHPSQKGTFSLRGLL